MVADFETTTDPEDCRVWGWGACDIFNDARVQLGTDIDSFLDFAQGFNSTIYFHNLKFDGTFILDRILKDGYMHTDERPRPGEFSTLISDLGRYYSITVRWRNGKRTEFRNSLNKLPMSVARVAESFKMEISKGEIDYHAPRPVGYKLTDEEKDYIIRDIKIVAKALRLQLEEGMSRLTVGADSLAEYKRLVSSKMFQRMFPVLPLPMDAEIRAAYRGGFTYADERTRGKIVGPGRAYDVNSLYPAVMYDRLLPYGEPKYHRGFPTPTESRPLYIVSITFTAKLKPGHIPCIQVKNHHIFASTEYLTEISEPVTLAATNVDLELWHEHYDMDILTYNGGWSFHATSGVFVDYIDKWAEIKNNETGGLREIAKLHLNSLYGKFATNPNVTGKIPTLDERGAVKLVTGPEETRNPVYTAMGVFITAYARDVTVRAAQRHYDSFLYADTDSLHLAVTSDPDTLDVDPHRLGAWKYEYSFDRALFARAKAYTTETDGVYTTHIAGLPKDAQNMVRFHHYMTGEVFSKLQPRNVPGGQVLYDRKFTLKKLI